MNCSRRTTPGLQAPHSVTSRWSAEVASDFDPRNARVIRRVSPVTASGSEVAWRRQTPEDRSVSVPVRGFVIIHDDRQSHPNRTTVDVDTLKQRLGKLHQVDRLQRRIAPDRTRIRAIGRAANPQERTVEVGSRVGADEGNRTPVLSLGSEAWLKFRKVHTLG